MVPSLKETTFFAAGHGVLLRVGFRPPWGWVTLFYPVPLWLISARPQLCWLLLASRGLSSVDQFFFQYSLASSPLPHHVSVYVPLTPPTLFSASSSQKASSGNGDCCNNPRGSGGPGLPSFPQHDSQVSKCVFASVCLLVCVRACMSICTLPFWRWLT